MILTKSETISSFEVWRQNLYYTFSLDPNFAPFLAPECSWLKFCKTAPKRDLTDDPSTDNAGADIPTGQRRTAAQKAAHLELMLGQIANFCPIIARNTIVKNYVSIDSIWQAIRLHFGFQTTGSHFLDFCTDYITARWPLWGFIPAINGVYRRQPAEEKWGHHPPWL